MNWSYRNPWLWAIAIIAIIGAIWWWRSSATTTTTPAVTTTAQSGTLVQSVTGSGSLIPKIQADVTAPAYGRVDGVYVKNGQMVTADQPLFRLHSLATDADKAKALASLLSAQDSLNQAVAKTTTLQATLVSNQQALQDAQKNEQITTTTLASADASLKKAGVDATKATTDAQKAVTDAQITQSKAGDDLSTQSADLGAISAKTGITSTALANKQAVAQAQTTLETAQRDQASAHLKTENAQLAYAAAQQTLANQNGSIAAARANLASTRLDYQMMTDQVVTAPVAGEVVNLSFVPGGTVGNSSGNNASTASSSTSSSSSTGSSGSKLFSIIDFTSLKAVVQVSEVDIPNVKLGQPATLTFDALPDKTYTGTVTNLDTVGTTTSGVTNYNVEITLDSLPSELKPGMTVSASIITNRKDHVLLVPSSAVQTQNGQSTVQVVRGGTTQTVPVTVGDSNDSETEITSGLSAGDTVVVTPARAANSPSSFSGGGGGGFGGGRGGGFRLGG